MRCLSPYTWNSSVLHLKNRINLSSGNPHNNVAIGRSSRPPSWHKTESRTAFEQLFDDYLKSRFPHTQYINRKTADLIRLNWINARKKIQTVSHNEKLFRTAFNKTEHFHSLRMSLGLQECLMLAAIDHIKKNKWHQHLRKWHYDSLWFQKSNPKANAQSENIWFGLRYCSTKCLAKTLYFILLILLTTFSTRLAWNINIEFICAVAPPTHLGHARALWGKILGSRMVLRGFVFFLQKSSHIHKPLHCDPHSQKSTCNEDNTIVEWNVKANIRGDFY